MVKRITDIILIIQDLPSTLVDAWMAVFFAWVICTRSTPYFLLFTVRFCLHEIMVKWKDILFDGWKLNHLRSLFTVVYYNLIIFTTWNKGISRGRKVNVVDPICIFLKNFCHPETSNNWLGQFHLAFNVHSVLYKRQEKLFAKGKKN